MAAFQIAVIFFSTLKFAAWPDALATIRNALYCIYSKPFNN